MPDRKPPPLALAFALVMFTLLAAASVQPAAAHDGASSPDRARQEFWLPAVFVDYRTSSSIPRTAKALAISTAASTWPRKTCRMRGAETTSPAPAPAIRRMIQSGVRLRINYFRAMAGVPGDISLSPEVKPHGPGSRAHHGKRTGT